MFQLSWVQTGAPRAFQRCEVGKRLTAAVKKLFGPSLNQLLGVTRPSRFTAADIE